MKKEDLMVASYFIYSTHRTTKEKRLDLIIDEMIDKKGKTKYESSIPSFNYFENPKKMNELRRRARVLKRKNPDFEVYYCTRKELKRDKQLKKVLDRKIFSLIEENLKYSFGTIYMCFSNPITILTVPSHFLLFVVGLLYILPNYKILNSYIKKFYSKSQRKVYFLELLYSLFLFMLPVSSYQERLQMGVDATVKVEQEVETEDSIFDQADSKEEKIDILYDTLKNNPNINELQYDYFQCFDNYYEANSFLNYEMVNQNYQSLRIEENASLSKNTVGKTKTRNGFKILNIPPTKLILLKQGIFDDNTTSYHEGIHLTGRFPYKFLDEGMVELITSEFCLEPTNSAEEYDKASYFVRILTEIVGPDAMLQAFSEESMGPINVELEKILDEREPRRKLYQAFDKIELYFIFGQEEKYLEAYQDAFQALTPYTWKKFGISLDTDFFIEPLHPCQEYVKAILEERKSLDPQKAKRYVNQ